MFPPSVEKDQSSTEDAGNELKSFSTSTPSLNTRAEAKEDPDQGRQAARRSAWYIALLLLDHGSRWARCCGSPAARALLAASAATKKPSGCSARLRHRRDARAAPAASGPGSSPSSHAMLTRRQSAEHARRHQLTANRLLPAAATAACGEQATTRGRTRTPPAWARPLVVLEHVLAAARTPGVVHGEGRASTSSNESAAQLRATEGVSPGALAVDAPAWAI